MTFNVTMPDGRLVEVDTRQSISDIPFDVFMAAVAHMKNLGVIR